MWDRATFVRSVAHRGLHDASVGIFENTRAAFDAAIEAGYAIECDVQRTKDNVPIVFHDDTLDHVMDGSGAFRNLTFDDIKTHTYRTSDQTIQTFAALLEQVRGRVPLLIELKSEWGPPALTWLATICGLAIAYTGPVALMSLDPDVMMIVKNIAPKIPRGLVSRNYCNPDSEAWWPKVIDQRRASDLQNLTSIDALRPNFIAYHVKDLDTPAVKHARTVLELPIFTWTVRTSDDWQLCTTFADAAIFEGQHL